MILKTKTFDALTTKELYELLRLRSEVFIVEQKSIYQDLDGIDYESLHLFCENEAGEILACLRLYEKKDEPGTIQIGRVVSRVRRQGYGMKLMDAAIREAKLQFHAKDLYITGRKSALPFYLSCGFHKASPELHAMDVSYYQLRRSI